MHKMNKFVWLGLSLLFCGGCAPSSPDLPKIGNERDTIVEAESTRKATVVGTHYWMAEKGNPSHLVAFPSDNTVFDWRGGGSGAPSITYRVIVEQPGTYYLWVRGQGEAGGASVIPGFDGKPISEDADFMGFFPGQFAWLNGLHSTGKRAIIQIDSAGEHTVKFWMLEDGFRFDKFMITADADRIPE
jgi:hypothetical protein